ncbi:MAG: NfeD family protein [Nitriliruptor sp.]
MAVFGDLRTTARAGGPVDRRLRRTRRRLVVLLATLLAGLTASLGAALAADPLTAEGPLTVGITEVTGTITPVTADHLAETIERAHAADHRALVVQLDTPGGLVDSTRTIVRTFLDAPLPIVVHVAPSGADAGSAGTFITYAANVAAMAPATTIGAATPVGGQGEDLDAKIIENTAAFAEAIAGARDRDVDLAVDAVREGRSVTAEVALEEGGIDLIVASTAELLEEIDGTEVTVRDRPVTLETAGAELTELEIGAARRILGFLADPNLAFVFLSLGTLAIVYEIANPGVGLGGVVGVTSIILAMFAFAVLPVNVAGVALLVLAAAMFVVELFAPGIGAGAGGGTAALLLGGLFLFPSDSGLGVDLAVLLPTVAIVAALTVWLGRVATRTRHVPTINYADHLDGRNVTVTGAAEGRPRAQLDGTWWRLRPDDGATLRDGEQVRVVGRDGLDLLVAAPEQHDGTTPDHPTRT